MLPSMQPTAAVRAVRWTIALAAAILFFVIAPAALADQPAPVDPNTCALCHQSEVQDWRSSPHAGAMSALGGAAEMTCSEATDPNCDCLTCHNNGFDGATLEPSTMGVTCDACHGPLVTGHPESGNMQLDVSSAVCSSCHVETHAEWQTTAHGEADVQCIGCHRSHSQNLRLDDETLCQSCHSERLLDSGHQAHARSGTNCIDCHTSPANAAISSDSAMRAPSHEFSVAPETCQSCHGETFHESSLAGMATNEAHDLAPAEAAHPTATAAAAPSAFSAASDRHWLQGATFASFGVGLGFGGMLGIVFVLIVGFLLQRVGRG